MLIKTAQNIIHSLLNLGWSVNAITHQAGISPVTVLNIKNGKSERITTAVAEKLQALFEKATEMNIAVLDSGPLERTNETPAPPAKKKPGRKPQPKTSVETTEQAPKKRGRPKKVASDAPKEQKKRGRPARKAVEAESVTEKPSAAAQELPKTPFVRSKMIKDDGSLDLAMLNAEIERLKNRVRDRENAKAAYFDLLAMLQ